MEPTPTYPFSDDDVERQRRAFGYLRNEARNAHSEGDGILAQHLATVAIRALLDLAKADRLRLRLRDYYWAPVFSLHWLVREYSLRSLTNEARSLLFDCEPEGNELRRLLTTLLFLVEQSLSSVSNLPDTLATIDLEWVSERDEIEASVLLTFVSELIWYRDPNGESWLRLLQHWQEVGPEHLRPALRETMERLQLQSAMTEPGGRYTLPAEPLEGLTAEARELYLLWRAMLSCDFLAVNAVRARLLPKTPFDSRVARILFDVHHWLRIGPGPFGDPQDVGLTRRKVQTTLAKAEAVPRARDQLFSEEMARNLRKGPAAVSAVTRFHCFRLGMLKEIFALRAWDFSEWRDGLEDQSDALLEVVRVDQCPPPFAASAIRLAVQASAFSENDPLIRNATAVFDLVAPDERAQLVRRLLNSHILQWPSLIEALTAISDATPEEVLPQVADWSVRYVHESRHRSFSFKAAPLAFWKDILPVAKDAAALCTRLFPGFLEEAGYPRAWMGEGGLSIRAFLRHAASEQAVPVIERMLSTESPKEQLFHIERWSLIYDTLLFRPDLRQPALIKSLRDLLIAPQISELPVFVHYIGRFELGEVNGRPLTDPIFAAWLTERARGLCITRDDQTFPTDWFGLVKWTENDSEMVTHFIQAIDEPGRSCTSIHMLLRDLGKIAETGNLRLNDQIAAALSRWLATPPTGKNRNQLSPFSIVRMTEPDQRHVTEALAFLCVSLLHTGMTVYLLPALLPWLRIMAAEPPAPAAGYLAYIAFRCSLLVDEPAASLLVSAGREITLCALNRVENHDEWRDALSGTLWKLSALINESVDPLSPLSGAMQKPAAEGLLQLLMLGVSRLANSRHAILRIATAQIALKLDQSGFSTMEVRNALKCLAHDARARVRHAATQ